MDILGGIVERLSSECGISGAMLLGGLVYQTWQLGRVRADRERDREQIVADAQARTKTAEAHALAQQEIALALARTPRR